MRGLEVANVDPMNPKRLALKFLKKLDQVIHGNMFVHVMNGSSACCAFPEYASAAYVIVEVWKSASVRVADSRGVIASGATFILEDDVRGFIVDIVSTPSTRRPNIATLARKPSNVVPARGNARSTMRPKVRFPSPPTMRTIAAPRAFARNKRAYYNCKEVGHLFVKCPHPIIVADGDEYDDESALYDAAMRRDDATCMMTRSVCASCRPRDRILFSHQGYPRQCRVAIAL